MSTNTKAPEACPPHVPSWKWTKVEELLAKCQRLGDLDRGAIRLLETAIGSARFKQKLIVDNFDHEELEHACHLLDRVLFRSEEAK